MTHAFPTRRSADLVQHGGACPFKLLPRIPRAFDRLGDPQFRHVQRGVVQFNEERVLRLDVVVERSTQHARLFADVAHRCPAIAFSGEQPRSNLHDLTASAGTLVTRSKRRDRARSEEHTSELQSLMRISYAVFCLK